MTYLLDTNVVSELWKTTPDGNVRAWFENVATADLFLSVLVVGELRQGVERLRRRDPVQAEVYERRLNQLHRSYADRVVPIDVSVAEAWARMSVPDKVPVVDGLMAATAFVHGLTLVTRNIADVAPTGAAYLDPFAPSAGGGV